MDSNTSEALGRAHERIDDLIKCVSRTAALQERLTEDIHNLTIATREALHHSPCRDLCQTIKAVEELRQANEKMQQSALESHRDWRRWILDVLKLAVVGAGAAIATRAGDIWQWINNIRHTP